MALRLSDLQNKDADGELACRRCGCRDLRPVEGEPRRRVCRHCGREMRVAVARDSGNGQALGIRCPTCGRAGSQVVKTTQRPGRTHRRRECGHCGRRWTTCERGR